MCDIPCVPDSAAHRRTPIEALPGTLTSAPGPP